MSRLGEMILRFGKAVSSAVKDNGVVTISIAGIGGLTDEDDDEAGEANPDADVFGGLGDIVRPLPPDKKTGDFAEKLSVKMHDDDDDTVISWRDLRLAKIFPNPKEGSIARSHYGGGFWAFDMTEGNAGDQKGSVYTLYVPYSFSGGVPAKAHAISIDAAQKTIQIVHGSGLAILMSDDGMLIKNAAGDAYIQLNAAGITLNGNLRVTGQILVGQGGASLPVLTGVPQAGQVPSTTIFAT